MLDSPDTHEHDIILRNFLVLPSYLTFYFCVHIVFVQYFRERELLVDYKLEKDAFTDVVQPRLA